MFLFHPSWANNIFLYVHCHSCEKIIPRTYNDVVRCNWPIIICTVCTKTLCKGTRGGHVYSKNKRSYIFKKQYWVSATLLLNRGPCSIWSFFCNVCTIRQMSVVGTTLATMSFVIISYIKILFKLQKYLTHFPEFEWFLGMIGSFLCNVYTIRQMSFMGTALATTSLVLASFATSLWHLYVTFTITGIQF